MKRSRLFTHQITIIFSLIVIFVLGPFLFYNISFMGRIYPNIYVAGIDIGGKTQEEATKILINNVETPPSINLASSNKSFDISTIEIGVSYNFNESVSRAYNLVRSGNLVSDFYQRLKLFFDKKEIGLITNIDDATFSKKINAISDKLTRDPVYPSIQNVSGVIQVNRGSKGAQIDSVQLKALIGRNLSYAYQNTINIPLEDVDPTLSDEQIKDAKLRGQKYLGKSLTLKLDSDTFDISEGDIFKTINPAGGYYDQEVSNEIYKLASLVNREPQDSKFEFNGTRATEFQPALDGITLNSIELKDLFTSNLDKLGETDAKNIVFDIPVIKTKPNITTDQVNNLGIKELIGRGSSTYFHSIPGRVFNVNLAASRINGTLVAPGETFSFNQTLGDVSKFTGFQQAYIISGGRTILGDGGGVCQVSTTLFRATLNAGLPIVERAAHAYRVGYYEQNSPPGIDATVYGPSPDFKFTNDTPGYILIQAKNNSKNYSLVFELYGTRDGRIARVTKPIISKVSPALPTIYQDDPTLPVGTLKQTDFAAAGARVSFDYSVEKDGEQVFQKTFISNYQPWAAVYLRGTKI